MSYDASRTRWAFLIVFVICALVSCTGGLGIMIGDVGIGLEPGQRERCWNTHQLTSWAYILAFVLALFGVAWARVQQKFVFLALILLLIGPTAISIGLYRLAGSPCLSHGQEEP